MGVQRGESSEVQKVSSDFKQIKLSASHSGPFQADLTAASALHCVTLKFWLEALGRCRGHTQLHTQVCGALLDPGHCNRVGSHRKGTASLSPSLTEPVCVRGPREKGPTMGLFSGSPRWV